MADPEEKTYERRFGRAHDKPCKNPDVITCAQWECQSANECQWKAMTQEQDIVERLLDASTHKPIERELGTWLTSLCQEAAQTIAALRVERDEALKQRNMTIDDLKRALEDGEAAEAEVEELEAVVRSLQKELKRSAEAGLRVMDQRTTAIRERDELESRITAYKKDIISLGRECGKEWERAEAAEAKVKELEHYEELWLGMGVK